VHTRLRQYTDALAAFDNAVSAIEFAETADLASRVSLRRFDTLVILGRYPEASNLIKEFLEKNPGHPTALQKFRKLEARRE
jgi:tetratricopeptide (TPR) repeat protein